MCAKPPLVEISNLWHTFQPEDASPLTALREIDLTIKAGEIVALVGANGSGKTTLARHLNGLLQPTQGQVRVAGLDTRKHSNLPAIRSRVGMVFQRPEDQIVATTVEDDVAFGPENLNLPAGEIQQRVRWALETVDMWHLRQRSPHQLSVGQQQRVAIAGALAMRPDCLVLDEATAMLDPAGRQVVMQLVNDLNAAGIAIVLITHWMEEVMVADRVVALAGGRIAYDGPPADLFADGQRLRSLGLALPPLAQLAESLARRWPFVPPGLYTADALAQLLLPHLPRNDGRFIDHQQERADDRPPAITLHELAHTYLPGSSFAAPSLHGVDLQLATGDAMALLGPTGSGKSTLLQLVANLLPPSAGSVQLAAGAGAADRKQVGILLQRPEEQLFETYVGDDVAFGPRQLELDRPTIRQRVRWAMELVGLPFDAFKDRFCTALSGGEQRKAALAGVLALRPQILLLDEPTAGLDPRSRSELLAALQRMRADEQITLLVATHDLEEVTNWAQRAAILNEGRMVFQGPLRTLFGQPDLVAEYGLRTPAVPRLMQHLKQEGAALPAGVLTVDEASAALDRALGEKK